MESMKTEEPEIEECTCRACMSKGQHYLCIMDVSGNSMPLRIHEMLTVVVPQMLIQARDGLPEWICPVCRDKLTVSYEFQQMCIKSDEHLRAMVGDMDIISTETQQDPLVENNYQAPQMIKTEVSENDDERYINIPQCDVAIIQNVTESFKQIFSESNENSNNRCPPKTKQKKLTRVRRSLQKTHDETESDHKTNSSDQELSNEKSARRCYKCPNCPRRFDKREALAAHSRKHVYEGLERCFKCEYCPKAFHKATVLLKHQSRYHPQERKFICEICNKAFKLNKHLISHMNKHKGIKPFVCTICEKAFQQKCLLEDHMRSHTNERPFLCPQCGKSFKSNANLQQHLLRHSGERRYQCPECPSRFTCQSDQIKHTAIHKNIKPHVCDICGSSYTRASTLKKHKYTHTGERPFKCDECNLTFVFIHIFRRHQRTHTGEKPYKCRLCERAYADTGDLNKHMRTHVGEKTYMCKQCPEAFKYYAELREHQAQHYKEQLAATGTTQSNDTCVTQDEFEENAEKLECNTK